MSEKEIRGLLRTICDRLDQRARRVTRKVVVPSMLGASLALSGCGDGRAVPGDGQVVSEAAPVYAAPMDARPPEAGPAPDAGPIPVDGRPVEVGPAPDSIYQAPDAGPIPPYLAPDAGPQPDYLAPDVGPVPLYLGPPPDGAP